MGTSDRNEVSKKTWAGEVVCVVMQVFILGGPEKKEAGTGVAQGERWRKGTAKKKKG